MSDKLNKPTLRGLRWIHDHAYAVFEDVVDEPLRTGQFTGTTRKEVSDALNWLAEIVNKNEFQP